MMTEVSSEQSRSQFYLEGCLSNRKVSFVYVHTIVVLLAVLLLLCVVIAVVFIFVT